MKTICILGSTGSIGQNSLEVIAHFPGEFRPAYLTTNTNTRLLQAQVDRWRPDAVAVLDAGAAAAFRAANPSLEGVDIVISSLVGFAGLVPTIEAVKRGTTVALANKETLVVAGELITRLVREHGATLLPIDSEHSAILQCLAGEQDHHVDRLILTASGGPFLNLPKSAFADVTVEQALRHPNWSMGKKITIDSATMMNKGLEIIEAHWLFSLPASRIDVLIHPQSIIHSMVEFIDGSVKAQLGIPDMKIPIQFALTYPERARSTYERVNFAKLGTMTFFEPDTEKFECLGLAYRALTEGGTAPAVLNAANEIAVELFLEGRIGFDQIPLLISAALDRHPVRPLSGLDAIVEADRETRASVRAHGNQLTRKAYAGT
jgi:1-deoxy-D-xylulose-5-phosphate reductoisomerase